MKWQAGRGSQLLEERNKRVVPLSKEYESSTPSAISLAQDGSVDFRGNPVNKLTTGRVKANVFIIGEFCAFKKKLGYSTFSVISQEGGMCKMIWNQLFVSSP
jgi:hypothetical protein